MKAPRILLVAFVALFVSCGPLYALYSQWEPTVTGPPISAKFAPSVTAIKAHYECSGFACSAPEPSFATVEYEANRGKCWKAQAAYVTTPTDSGCLIEIPLAPGEAPTGLEVTSGGFSITPSVDAHGVLLIDTNAQAQQPSLLSQRSASVDGREGYAVLAAEAAGQTLAFDAPPLWKSTLAKGAGAVALIAFIGTLSSMGLIMGSKDA